MIGFTGWLSADSRGEVSPRETENITQTLEQQALPELIRTLTEKKHPKQLRILNIAGDIQDHRACDYLIQAYEETPSEGIRCKLLESMGKLHDPTLLKWLAKRLEDPHPSIQCFAIWAIGELKSPQTVNLLRRKLWSADRYVQMTAIDALGKTGKDWAVAAELGTFLTDTDVQLRYLAAKALWGVARPDMAPALAERLREESSIDVQEVLAKALGHAGGPVGIGHLIELLKYSSSPATEHLAEVGLEAADEDLLRPALQPLLAGSDFRLKVIAARILSEQERITSEP